MSSDLWCCWGYSPTEVRYLVVTQRRLILVAAVQVECNSSDGFASGRGVCCWFGKWLPSIVGFLFLFSQLPLPGLWAGLGYLTFGRDVGLAFLGWLGWCYLLLGCCCGLPFLLGGIGSRFPSGCTRFR